MDGTASELIRHIVDRYHEGLKQDLDAISSLIDQEPPDHALDAVASTFSTLRVELLSHLMKEERILFPHIVDMEAAAEGRRPTASLPTGLTPGVVSVMLREHGAAELALTSLRRLTDDYAPPVSSSPSRAHLLERLSQMENELRRHIALEDEVLFPKALELERTLGSSQR